LNMTLRASLQKLKQNISQLREALNRAAAQRHMSSLMSGGNGSGPAVNPWLVNESEETRGLSFAQDAGLDALASVISRQKQMGREIGNELDEQNESSSIKKQQ
ncbi:hypothetical protein DNTS_034970, partial [Danionella cerebrum]